MKRNVGTRFLVIHALAIGGTTLVLTILPFLGFWVMSLLSIRENSGEDDSIGPMLLLLPLVGAGVFTVTFLFPAVAVLQWARTKFNLGYWHLALTLLVSMLGSGFVISAFGENGPKSVGLIIIALVYPAVGFTCYWTSLFLANKVIRVLRDKRNVRD